MVGVALPPGRRSYALWAGGRGVGATTPTSPLPALRLHRLTGRRGGFAQSVLNRQNTLFDVGRSMFDVRSSSVSFGQFRRFHSRHCHCPIRLSLALTLIREFCMLGERIGTIPRFFIILESSRLETFVFDILRVFVR